MNNNYTKVSNEFINDTSISPYACKLYLWMKSKPCDWEFYQQNIASALNWRVETVRKYINELIDKGWVHKTEQQRENGVFTPCKYLVANKCTVDGSTVDGDTVHGNTRDGRHRARQHRARQDRLHTKTIITKTDITKTDNNKDLNTNNAREFFEDVSDDKAEVLLAKSKEDFNTRAARQQIAKSIMEQFNQITGKNFPLSSHNTIAAIVKILDQYEEGDIIKVIELKTLETKVYRNGTPVFSRAHLTPFTLFEETKFEKYLQNANDKEYIIELKKVYDNERPKTFDAERALRTIDRVIAERRAAKDAAKA